MSPHSDDNYNKYMYYMRHIFQNALIHNKDVVTVSNG